MDNDVLHQYSQFYPSDITYADGMRTLMGDAYGRGMATYVPDIEFASPAGRTLKMQLLRPALPWDLDKRAPAPLIVFVQGSAWRYPNAYNELPQLASFAREGYVVASIEHRASDEVPFPACLIDVKSAIRFLRAHAAEYGIDPTRVAIWGTSSGGNLALLTAATENVADFEVGDNLNESSSVQAVIDFFGPSNLVDMMKLRGLTMAALADPNLFEISNLIGGPDGDALGRLKKLSPGEYLRDGVNLPPHLIIHGDCDNVVPFSQSSDYYKLLRSRGQIAHLIKVAGAGHERRFWTQGVLDEVSAFLRAYL